MKKFIMIALALVAGASVSTAGAAKKKTASVVAPVVEPVRLADSTDSVSYAAGMAITNGLVPFLHQQKVDSALMADFVRGFQDGVKAMDDPQKRAYLIGMGIAQQVSERMLPGMVKDFQDSPDSIKADLFYRGFTDALKGDTALFTQSRAEEYFTARQKADKAAREERLYGANRDAGRQFLAENGRKDSVITLPSGLQYKVLVKGEGRCPSRPTV